MIDVAPTPDIMHPLKLNRLECSNKPVPNLAEVLRSPGLYVT